jgi:hypothetical protein
MLALFFVSVGSKIQKKNSPPTFDQTTFRSHSLFIDQKSLLSRKTSFCCLSLANSLHTYIQYMHTYIHFAAKDWLPASSDAGRWRWLHTNTVCSARPYVGKITWLCRPNFPKTAKKASIVAASTGSAAVILEKHTYIHTYIHLRSVRARLIRRGLELRKIENYNIIHTYVRTNVHT